LWDNAHDLRRKLVTARVPRKDVLPVNLYSDSLTAGIEAEPAKFVGTSSFIPMPQASHLKANLLLAAFSSEAKILRIY
jgi:hypothetical protein